MKILAIDPGPERSSYALWDGVKLYDFGYIENAKGFDKEEHADYLLSVADAVVFERVACYGMPVGVSIFETVYWTGRLIEQWIYITAVKPFHRVERKTVKMHLCQSMRAKDSNIIQALKDRFGDKGTKNKPGFFYGFASDMWQAFALAVCFIDQLELNQQATAKE